MGPDLDDVPTRGLEHSPLLAITQPIAAEFCRPEGPIRPRERIGADRASVPEAPVDEHRDLLSREDHIWANAYDSKTRAIAADPRPPEVPT